MRGQVWTEALLIVGGIVIGVLVAFGNAFPVFVGGAEVVRALPYVALAEVYAEQNALYPYSVTDFYYDGNNLVLGADPEDATLRLYLSSWGVNVR